MSLSGLAQLNLDICATCDKTHLCPMCGHQDPAVNPNPLGVMDFELLTDIRRQIEPGILISFHRDGEPTAYPRLSEALGLFAGFTTSLVTHGLNLGRRAEDIIGRCTTVTVSVFSGDRDRAEQIASLGRFLSAKGDRLPTVQVKIVGDMEADGIDEYEALGVRVIRRLIHVPIDNSKYAHRRPTVPEVGICLDALHRPTIAWNGDVFLCNRFNPSRDLLIGSLRDSTLDAIWNGDRRRAMLDAHRTGHRELANETCAKCTYWGVASE